MDEHSEKFNEELENIKKNQIELKNIITEIQNTLEGSNSRLDDTEKRMSNLEDRVVEITQTEKKKNFFKELKTGRQFKTLRKRGQLNIMRNEREVTTDTNEIQRIIGYYHEQL